MIVLRRFAGRWEAFLLLVLTLTLVAGAQASQYFLTASNISIAIAGAIPIAIVSLSMTLVIITGEIDISVGSMIGLCATTIAISMEEGAPVGLAMAAGMTVGALAGLINGLLIVGGALPSLVVTIGTLALYRGIAQIILKERGFSSFPDWYQELGFGTIPGTAVPWSLLIFLVCFAGFALFLHATHWGRALYAIGNNREAARYSGVAVNRMMVGLFVTSGLMSSLAAIILTAYLASARSDTGIGLELPVVTVVVLGGVSIFGGSGTLGGVFVALLVLAFAQNALGLAGVTPEEQQIVTGALLVTTLMLFSGVSFVHKFGRRL
jgi:rhamnose transport system permease protein